MMIPVRQVSELGLVVRATRRTSGLRLDDVAGSAGVGPVFAGDVERGKDTVQLGRVLRLLDELGVRLLVDVPDEVMPEWQALQVKGVKPRRPRRPKADPAPETARE